MPSSPPVTSGLSVWLCSDTNVDTRPDGTVVTWGSADGSGIQAVAVGSTRPQFLGGQINGWPVLRFSGAQGMFLQTGVIAQDSFTLVVVGRSFDPRSMGGSGLSGQKMVFYQDGSQAQTNASVSVGWNGVGIYEFGVNDYPRAEAGADAACFCPLVVRYENKSLNVWLTGNNVISNGSNPSQPVGVPHGIGGTGDATGGFAGDIAEVLIYNRALNDWERQMVEQYVQAKYACGPSSSSSSSEESSSSSSEQSSEQSSAQSSEQSSEQSSSSSSEESSSSSSEQSSEQSSWSSEWSSESPSSSSSEESSSSSCSCQMPSDPVPVTDGLVAWQRSDLNLSTDGSGQVLSWGAVCDCLPNMTKVSSVGPLVVGSAFGSYPGVQFSINQTQQLCLEGGELGNNNFTLFVVARPEADRVWNGSGVSGQRLLLSDNGGSGAHAALSAGLQSLALYEFQYSSSPRLEAWMAGCLCPVVVRYENKQASVYVSGALIAQDGAMPGYDIFIPRNLGGWINADPNAGFVGGVAEVLFYNRALSDYERQLVEQYVQNRYGCLSSSSSDSSSSEESSSSSEESSWSSEDSSAESSWESSAESSYEPPSSSCSPEVVPDPVPVTDGLVVWQRADRHVNVDVNNQVTLWGGANGCLPDAERVTYAGPVLQMAGLGQQPIVEFSGAEGLRLIAGELGSDSFTILILARPDWSHYGSYPTLLKRDSSQNNTVATICADAYNVTLFEPDGSSGARLNPFTGGGLCPLTLVYENKQVKLYVAGGLAAQDSSTPGYSIFVPRLLGGSGSDGFVGAVSEVLVYNRALSDLERQQVEIYMQNRYACITGGSSEESSESSEGASSDSSESESESSSSSSEEQSNSSSSGGLSISGPSRIGISSNGTNRSVIFDVYAPTPELASQVNLVPTQGSGKVSVAAINSDFSDGVASFQVTGLEPSDTPGDVELTAMAEGETAKINISVVIPKKFGVIPNIDQNVAVQARALDLNSNPKDPNGTPGYHTAVYLINVTIEVGVLDQFNSPIGDIYSGATVKENGVSTNTSLKWNGTYDDYVGMWFWSSPPRPGDANSQQAAIDVQALTNNYNQAPNFLAHYTAAKQVFVDVGGFSLGSFTRSHDFHFDAPAPPCKTGRYKVTHSFP